MEITKKYIQENLEQMTKTDLNALYKKYIGKGARNIERDELIYILANLDALRYAYELIEYDYSEIDPKKWSYKGVKHYGKTYYFEKIGEGKFKLEINKHNSVTIENFKDELGNYKHHVHIKNGVTTVGSCGNGWLSVNYLVK